MTLPTMAFSPAIGLRDNITYPNPATGTAAREQVQGRNDELRDFINGDFSDAIDKRTITAKTTTYTVLATDLNTDITCTGTFTVTLPLISTTGFGVGFRCRVSNVSTGVITVASTSTDTISGVASVTVNPGKSIEITADAAGKWTVHGFDFTDLISNLAGAGRTTETVKTNADAITGKVSKSGDTMSGTLNVDADIASRLAGTTTKKSVMKYDATYDSGVVSAEDSGTRFKPITVVSDGFKYRPSIFSVGDAYNFFGTGTALPATTGSMTATMDSSIKTITPTGSCTFNASGGITGQDCTFIITTSGTTSYTLTFGTNFKTTGTLATGVSSGKVFAITFRYDGTNWVETGRTAAM